MSYLLEVTKNLIEQKKVEKAVELGPQIIREYYQKIEGRELNIVDHPSFCAKIHQRMIDLHTKGAKKATLIADKLRVKKYIADCIGENYIPKVKWQADVLTRENFRDMPKTGVLKCNEGCGKNITLKEGQPFEQLKAITDDWVDKNYYWFRREFQYLSIPRKIFVEELINDGHEDGPLDFIFFCFDGKVELIQTGSRSHRIHSFFTPSWKQLNLTYREKYEAPNLSRPSQLTHMIEVAQEISKGFDFVRVDLYQEGERVLFGEMTLTPRAGEIQFTPSEWNMTLGKLWNYRHCL